MQSQLFCVGCRHLLLYPRGASSVRCSICNTISAIAPATETAQLLCVGCGTLLLYPRGATSVRCACCHTTTDASVAQVNCSHCHITLAYPSGAPSVRCARCEHITNVGMSATRVPIPIYRPNGTMPATFIPSTSAPKPHARSQTVVVENPITMDESGKLVTNVVVGVTSDKK